MCFKKSLEKSLSKCWSSLLDDGYIEDRYFDIYGEGRVWVCVLCIDVFSKFLMLQKKKKMENLTTIVRYSVMWNDEINCKGGLSFNVVKAPYILCREG